ncbi:MAG: NADH-quinone oxidoreductase subunit L [Deltaproteobacteria bacterium]|nr:NADH-quinone oxidoreductase subunit L [Deltaproteobacteria bacterium]
MSELVPILFLIPLLGAALNGLVLTRLSSKAAAKIGLLASVGSFAVALSLSMEVLKTGQAIQWETSWIAIGRWDLRWGFVFDQFTLVMALMVTGIGSLIHLYSIGYMAHDDGVRRFFSYLNLFLAAMLVLVTGDNLLVLFVGWEGVGLCSYLLIGFWFKELKNTAAGMKAFIVNRVGDAAFLLGIFLCLKIFGSVSFSAMQTLVAGKNSLGVADLEWIGLLLFIGAMGKSAQIPLFVWLPDAMAGPTPVSALIHAATMVTAGIYMVCRMGFLYQVAPHAAHFVAVTGAMTALFAATIACVQRDIKKVLAYSTISQLGLMFLAAGVGNYAASLFHVVTHAFFKACLFLGAGSVIHALSGEQDIKGMGGLRSVMPSTFITFFVSVLAISGVPPLAGFFSKDEILYSTLTSEGGGWGLWISGLAVSGMTAFYMTRLCVLTFFGRYRGHAHPHESPPLMTIPLWATALGAAVGGVLSLPRDWHLAPDLLGRLIHGRVPEFAAAGEALSEGVAMIVTTGVGLAGIILAVVVYGLVEPKFSDNPRGPKTVLWNKYWVDELYDVVFVAPFRGLTRLCAVVIDPKVIDGFVILCSRATGVGGSMVTVLQSGRVQAYLLVMVAGALAIILWLGRGVA